MNIYKRLKKKKTSIRQYKHRIDSMKMLYYESILKLLDHHIPNVHQIAEKLIVIKKKTKYFIS